MVDNQMTNMKKRDTVHYMPSESEFQQGLKRRRLYGRMGEALYYFSIFIAILALVTLFYTVINQAFGAIAVVNEVPPASLVAEGQTLDDLSAEALLDIIRTESGRPLQIIVLDYVSSVPRENFAQATVTEMVGGGTVPDELADLIVNDIRQMEDEARDDAFISILLANLDETELRRIIDREIVKPQIVEAWKLSDAVLNWAATPREQQRLDEIPQLVIDFEAQITTLEAQIADLETQVSDLREQGADENRAEITEVNSQISALRNDIEALNDDIEALEGEEITLVNNNILVDVERNFSDAEVIRYHSWINDEFLTVPMSSTPADAGIRTAILGSVYMIMIVILVTLPIGVGTAIYLEEYANSSWLNRMIETNVRNLAGVPSIIYGLLGLSIFVRALAPLMSGVVFGVGAEAPTDARIIDALADVISVNFVLEDERYVGIEENDLLTSEQARELVNTFRRLRTPGINNLYGEVPPERAANAIRQALDLSGSVDIPVDRPSDITENMIDLDFSQSNITYEQYLDLTTTLVQFGSFTVRSRTLLAAALTLSLLILPIVIINSQEALRAVPYAYREASYGLGATQWQTIWRTVLPAAVPGIMTGTILAISRAIGETAPLIVVGASTFILTDPSGPFSQFTVLPIQIFNWTARPQGQFQFIAAAAILVLLTLVIMLNAIAIILRNRYSIRN